jgi:hypothetical protein
MSTSANNFDAIETLIYEEDLRIEAIDFHPELDVMLIILNTKAVLHQRISSYKALHNAKRELLMQYELIANGVGVHWDTLDEDLSLKGFLKDELRQMVKSGNDVAAA